MVQSSDPDEDLLAALHAAPKHGINARELLLSAARDPSLCQPQDHAEGQPQKSAQLKKPSADALWAALPPSERPMVGPQFRACAPEMDTSAARLQRTLDLCAVVQALLSAAVLASAGGVHSPQSQGGARSQAEGAQSPRDR